MTKIKVGTAMEESIWRDIKAEAARRGMAIDEFLTGIFLKWKGEQDDYCKSTNPGSGPKNWNL